MLPGFHRAVLLFVSGQVAVKMQATPATKRTSAPDPVFVCVDREMCLILVDESAGASRLYLCKVIQQKNIPA